MLARRAEDRKMGTGWTDCLSPRISEDLDVSVDVCMRLGMSKGGEPQRYREEDVVPVSSRF